MRAHERGNIINKQFRIVCKKVSKKISLVSEYAVKPLNLTSCLAEFKMYEYLTTFACSNTCI